MRQRPQALVMHTVFPPNINIMFLLVMLFLLMFFPLIMFFLLRSSLCNPILPLPNSLTLMIQPLNMTTTIQFYALPMLIFVLMFILI
jgi:hypothetical protein